MRRDNFALSLQPVRSQNCRTGEKLIWEHSAKPGQRIKLGEAEPFAHGLISPCPSYLVAFQPDSAAAAAASPLCGLLAGLSNRTGHLPEHRSRPAGAHSAKRQRRSAPRQLPDGADGPPDPSSHFRAGLEFTLCFAPVQVCS